MLGSKLTRLVVQALAVATGTLLMVSLLVPLRGPLWHLMNGDTISYQGWTIRVPKGYHVRFSGEAPGMWRLTLGIPWLDVPYGHISLFSLKKYQQVFVVDRDYAQFEERVTQIAHEAGYRFKAKHVIPVGNGSSGHCLEFGHAGGASRSLLRCVVENSAVVLYYEGDARYVRDAIDSVRGMTPKVDNQVSESEPRP